MRERVKRTEMLAIAWPLGYDVQPNQPRFSNISGRTRSNVPFRAGFSAYDPACTMSNHIARSGRFFPTQSQITTISTTGISDRFVPNQGSTSISRSRIHGNGGCTAVSSSRSHGSPWLQPPCARTITANSTPATYDAAKPAMMICQRCLYQGRDSGRGKGWIGVLVDWCFGKRAAALAWRQ